MSGVSRRLGPALRVLVDTGVSFLSAHPRVHRAIKAAYPLVPGLRPMLRRLLPGAATAVPIVPYVFEPVAPGAEEVVTLKGLSFLSRSL